MRFGLMSGAAWGLATVFVALASAHLSATPQTAVETAFLLDAGCALWIGAYMTARGRLGDTWRALSHRAGRVVIAGALLGGPIGTAGYVCAIATIGPAHTAIVSACYPAVGALAARLLLREHLSGPRVAALMLALGGVGGIGWLAAETGSDTFEWWGLAGGVACACGWGLEAVFVAWGMRTQSLDNEVALHIRETTSALAFGLVVVPLVGSGTLLTRLTPSLPLATLVLAAAIGTGSYLLYYRAIAHVGAARAMALNITYTVWALAFGSAWALTWPGVGELVCCAAVFVGTIGAASTPGNLARTQPLRRPRRRPPAA